MKFCSKCGKELDDAAVVCMGCGCAVPAANAPAANAAPAPTVTVKSSKASLVLGIVGIIVAWLFALAGHIVSIIGIVLGVKEYKNSGNAVGLVLSIIGEVCAIINSVLGVIMMSGLF